MSCHNCRNPERKSDCRTSVGEIPIIRQPQPHIGNGVDAVLPGRQPPEWRGGGLGSPLGLGPLKGARRADAAWLVEQPPVEGLGLILSSHWVVLACQRFVLQLGEVNVLLTWL